MNLYFNLEDIEAFLELKSGAPCINNSLHNLLISRFRNIKFSGVYFGQEFCSEMIPRLDDIKNVDYFCSLNNFDFVYVTGPTGQKDIKKIKKNLEYINKRNKKTEVVINEWGILKIINMEFHNLIPVLGRLLIKNRRMAHFDSIPRPSSHDIDTLIDKIELTQLGVLSKTNLNVKEYVDFLKDFNISRVCLDIVRTGLNLKHIKDFKIDIYASYAYITGGRLCRLAGIFEPERKRYVLSHESCRKYCKIHAIEFMPNFDKRIFYKYNSIFVKHDQNRIIEIINDNKKLIDRVILEYN